MPEVKRYNPEWRQTDSLGSDYIAMIGDKEGKWVKYSDYEELEKKSKALREWFAPLPDDKKQ